MSLQPALNRRWWSLDLARGFFILLMVMAHSIFFFHAKTHFLLQFLNGIGDLLAFNGLLFISGAVGYIAYIHYRHPTRSFIRRMSKRLFMYVAGYYLLSIYMLWLIEPLTTAKVIDILTFQRLVPFTEFIVTFIIFGLLKIPLRRLYQCSAENPWVLTMIAGTAYGLALVLYPLPVPTPFTVWKAILVGHEKIFSFPIFHYLPIYLVGITAGRQIFLHGERRVSIRYFSRLAAVGGGLVLGSLAIGLLLQLPFEQIFHRWPPSLPFLALGAFSTFTVLTAFFIFKDLAHFPWSRNFLLLMGQNTFALFFTQTLILATYSALKLPVFHGLLLVAFMSAGALWLSLYLAALIPLNYTFSLTFIKWCECQLGHCHHTREHPYFRRLKRIFYQILVLPQKISLNVFGRQIRLLKHQAVLIGIAAIMLMATPLGVAENQLIAGKTLTTMEGSLNRAIHLTTDQEPLVYTLNPASIADSFFPPTLGYQVNGEDYGAMQSVRGSYQVRLTLTTPGEYAVRAYYSIGNQRFYTKPTKVVVSAPLFVSWTIDWEGYDVIDRYLTALAKISAENRMPMTHLFSPRIYTDPEFPAGKAGYLTEWVKHRAEVYGEEIGLHLHMFPDFVNSAGLTPKTEPVWGGGFTAGYDILTTAYSQAEMEQILNHALDWFDRKDLGRPLSYRAGAWFANLDTLKALEASGFLVDSSGRTRYQFGTNHVAGFWDLDPAVQPYHPSLVNQNSSEPAPTLKIWEIPNNGADSYAYTGQQMIERFNRVYKPYLTEPQQITFLTHPHWFKDSEQQRVRTLFEYINRFRYDQNGGPVITASLQDIAKAWSSDE